jgi:hypothetical protein
MRPPAAVNRRRSYIAGTGWRDASATKLIGRRVKENVAADQERAGLPLDKGHEGRFDAVFVACVQHQHAQAEQACGDLNTFISGSAFGLVGLTSMAMTAA